MWLCVCFCFQAEDGIRDLVRSRGLGDVYKRQGMTGVQTLVPTMLDHVNAGRMSLARFVDMTSAGPVSYTHLTLPTSDLV